MSTKSEKAKVKIVYDLDDTAWGLNDVVYRKRMGLDPQIATHFKCTDNPALTDKQKMQILSLYGNPDVYYECQFYPGVERIFDLEKSGDADVWMCSSSLNESVMNVKIYRLFHEVPNINTSHVRLSCDESHKRESGDILVDDRLQNILNEDFPYNILINKPYNQCDSFPEGKTVYRVSSLNEAVDMVESIIERIYREDRSFEGGDYICHFKQEKEPAGSGKHFYQYIGEAIYTESGERLAIYQQVFSSDKSLGFLRFARPYEQFVSEVDHEKYPDVKQTYRLEKVPFQSILKYMHCGQELDGGDVE